MMFEHHVLVIRRLVTIDRSDPMLGFDRPSSLAIRAIRKRHGVRQTALGCVLGSRSSADPCDRSVRNREGADAKRLFAPGDRGRFFNLRRIIKLCGIKLCGIKLLRNRIQAWLIARSLLGRQIHGCLFDQSDLGKARARADQEQSQRRMSYNDRS